MQEEEKERLAEVIDIKAKQRLKANREKRRSLYFGLGMFGTVGWTVVIPTLLAAFLGRWIDNLYPGTISWTLTFIFIGLAAGCFMAWRWVRKQNEEE